MDGKKQKNLNHCNKIAKVPNLGFATFLIHHNCEFLPN